MKTNLLFLLTAIVLTNQILGSKALAASGQTYGMIASLGSEAHDLDIIISRRIDDTITFKYCSATKADGTATPITQYRKMRFLNNNLESNPAEFEKFKKNIFDSTEYCTVIGKPLYGINQNIFYSNGRIDPSIWTDNLQNWSGGVAAVAGFTAIYQSYNGAEEFFETAKNQNTMTFFKKLAATPKLGERGSIGLLALLIAGVGTYIYFRESSIPVGLVNLNGVTDNKETNHANITLESMPNIKLSLEIALKEMESKKAFIPL
jgi:hypothetical protein